MKPNTGFFLIFVAALFLIIISLQTKADCGDGVCDPGEEGWCSDCGSPDPELVCGDGVCDPGEEGWCSDCGSPDPELVCGDGVCDPGEEGWCSDCGSPDPEPVCGDYVCDPGEEWSCPNDCGAPEPVCGDGVCDPGEEDTCSQDCGAPEPVCGNGQCESGEDSWNCPSDCPVPPTCGDGTCDPGEEDTCSQDCGAPEPVCGDGECNGDENSDSCPQDCPVPCSDDYQDYRECTGCFQSSEVWYNSCSDQWHYENQVFDSACGGSQYCPPTCGDGECNGDENSDSCPQDCPVPCSDDYQDYRECTGCFQSSEVWYNSCSDQWHYENPVFDAACGGSDQCPITCEPDEYNECTGCLTSRRVKLYENCTYEVIVESQPDPACTAACPGPVTVSGRAFCEDDGSAVGGATVKLFNDRLNVVKTAVTDGNGFWSITDNFDSAIGGDHNYAFRPDPVGDKTTRNTYETLKVNSEVVQMTVFPFVMFSHNSLDFRYDCPSVPPPSNRKPEGFLDAADCNAIGGWTRDPDTTAPIDVHFYADGAAGAGGTFIGSARADQFRQDLCSLFGNGNADCTHGYSFNTPASLKNGASHSIFAYGIDSSGGENTLLTNSPRSIQCIQVPANRPPVLDPIGDRTVEELQLLQFAISGSDPDGDSLTFSALSLPPGSVFDSVSRTFSWTPAGGQAGDYQAAFSVSDGQLSDSETITIHVVRVRVNRAPVLDPIGDKTVEEGSLLQFTVSGSDPDGDALSFSAQNLPQGSSFDPVSRVFIWTPAVGQAGNYSVTFSVSDGELSDSEAIIIHVVHVNQPPVLDPIGNKQVNEGDLLQFTISGSDPDNDPLTFSASNLPSGAAFSQASRVFSWTPGFNQSGSYQVTFSVSDGQFSDSETIAITVINVNAPPRFVTTPPTEVVEPDLTGFSAIYRYEAHAVDPDGERVTYSLLVSPEGSVIDPDTGLVLWKPNRHQLGPDNFFTIVATDGTLNDTQSWSVNVKLPERIDIPRRDLFVEHAIIPECLAPGESDMIFLSVENTGTNALDGFTITALTFDDYFRKRIGPFDLDVGQREERIFLLNVPSYMPEGKYDLRLTFSNDFVRRVKHREFEVSNNCQSSCCR